jgi:hypothetical protein
MAQVKFLHEKFGGVPRNLTRYLRRLERRMLEDGIDSADCDYIQAVYVDLELHRERARRAMKHGYAEHPQPEPGASENAGSAEAPKRRYRADPMRPLHASKRRGKRKR